MVNAYDWENAGTMPRFENFTSPEPNTGCWLWLGSTDKDGYGRFGVGSRTNNTATTAAAHRVAYELFVGPIPEGLTIDHLCRVRCCVNPDHLEAVTARENLFRGETIPAENALKSHCDHGHAFTPENTYSFTGKYGARRNCRTCRAAAGHRHSLKKKAAKEARLA